MQNVMHILNSDLTKFAAPYRLIHRRDRTVSGFRPRHSTAFHESQMTTQEMTATQDEKTLSLIIRRLKRYSVHVDVALVKKAFEFAREAHKDQLRRSGEPYFQHCLNVAKILTDLKMDYITVAGGFLHDVVEDTGISLQQVEDEFGPEIALLVDGVTKISELKFDSIEARQAEKLRKMIMSMVKDIRVILIKFADRLHNMRTIEHMPERKRSRTAIETRDIYAPLAHRLGIAKVKWELEDLALKTLEPEVYWQLVEKVAAKREMRERMLHKIARPIRAELKKAGIKAKIYGRPKHLYSIYQKMKRRNKSFEEIYDLLALRIIVKKVEECYFALGLVHSIYTPIQARFKDYIATPKSNMYQSLHTTMIALDGKMVEVQIRTDEMHRTAEEGIAAHWQYKEDRLRKDDLDRHLIWLRQVLEWQHDTDDPQEFMENLRIDLFQDEVFVFSPKGDLYRLPMGSTPVDFAFAVHTDIGLHCIGAKANGRIVPLSYKLRSGDSIEILTSANQKPNPDWIKFTKTSKARSRLKRWLRESLQEQSRKLGEELFYKKLRKYKVAKNSFDLAKLASDYGYPSEELFFAALGRGDVSIQGVLNKLIPEKLVALKEESLLKKFISRARGTTRGVRVQGLDNLLINFAKCCQPVPGDKIIGFITRGRGIVVHRHDCRNIVRMKDNPDRWVDVEWDVDKDKQFMVRLRLLGEDRKHFLSDVSQTISNTETNIVSIRMKTEDSIVHSNIIIEVNNLQHLTRVLNRLSKVKGVISVERIDGTGDVVRD